MKTSVTTKSGAILTGRLCELYTGNCPPERPCDPQQVEAYRKKFDGEEATKQFPSLLQQAANLAGSVIRHVAGGLQNASEEEQNRRMSLCMACEHWQDERCSKCGCFTAAKTAWKRETCPVGKW